MWLMIYGKNMTSCIQGFMFKFYNILFLFFLYNRYKDFCVNSIIYFLLFIHFYTHEKGSYGNLLEHWTNKSCVKMYIKHGLGTVSGSI